MIAFPGDPQTFPNDEGREMLFWVKRVFLWLMAAFYLGAGLAHFRSPEFYVQIMPPYLPWHLPLVYLSGSAELMLGLAVLIPETRRYAAWGIILLLVAVFPANIHAAANDVAGSGIGNWLRLPFQAVFIAWAWWYTRPADSQPAALAT